MKTHLLASLLLFAAPLLACDPSTTPCAPSPAAKAPVAANTTHHGKTAAPLASPTAQNRHAALPPAPVAPAKSLPAPDVPAKTARPGYLFM